MKKVKYIKIKQFFADHPMGDMLKSICNPSGEDCNVTQEYDGIVFRLDSTTEDYFDEDGNKIRSVWVGFLNGPEENWQVSETKYDGNTNTHKSKRSNGSTDFIYDDHGNLVSILSYNKQGEVVRREDHELTYNEKGLLVKDIQHGSYTKEIKFEYDESGREICKLTLDDGVLTWKESRFYDEKGNLSRMEQAFYGDDLFDPHTDTPHYTLVSTFKREYDEEGRCVLEYLCCEDGLSSDELTTWEYQFWD